MFRRKKLSNENGYVQIKYLRFDECFFTYDIDFVIYNNRSSPSSCQLHGRYGNPLFLFTIVAGDAVDGTWSGWTIRVGFFSTYEVNAGTMWHHRSTRPPVLHVTQGGPSFVAEIVILHWQILPIHSHHNVDFGPSSRFGFRCPKLKIRFLLRVNGNLVTLG